MLFSIFRFRVILLRSWNVGVRFEGLDFLAHEKLWLLNIEGHGLGLVGTRAGRKTLGAHAFSYFCAETPFCAIIADLVCFYIVGLGTGAISFVHISYFRAHAPFWLALFMNVRRLIRERAHILKEDVLFLFGCHLDYPP